MSQWILVIGLTGLFLGVAMAISMAGAIGRERSQVSGSLAAIDAISGPVPEDMRRQLDQPFRERVTTPVQRNLTGLGRRLTGAEWNAGAVRRLDRAGNPVGWDPERLLAAKAGLAIALGLATSGVLILLGRTSTALLWGAALAVLGFFIPDLVLRRRADDRTDRIRRALPDSIDLLTVSVESGLAFDAALAQVAQNTEGPLAQEFTRVLKEVQIGSSRSEALQGLAGRTDVAELRIFLNSMIQAEKLGLPIAEVLRVQASEIRVKRSQMVEERAMKLPVKLVFPVMFCIMPSLFIVILGPAMITIMDSFANNL
jgi:tight adherence protein C